MDLLDKWVYYIMIIPFLKTFHPFPLDDICWCRHFSYLSPDNLTLFPHATNLQQTTLNIFCQKIENLYNWMDNLWLKVENIVSKREISCFMFSKKPSAAEASESVYMREMVKSYFFMLELSSPLSWYDNWRERCCFENSDASAADGFLKT